MRKIFFILITFFLVSFAFAFKPKAKHFKNQASYYVWKNFVKTTKIKNYAKASYLSSSLITLDYNNFEIDFVLENEKIVSMGIANNFISTESLELKKASFAVKQLLFYLNCSKKRYTYDFTKKAKISFKKNTANEAIDLIFKNKNGFIKISNINTGYDENSFTFILQTSIGEIIFEIPANFELPVVLEETKTSIKAENIYNENNYKPKLPKAKIKKTDPNWQLDSLSYIEKYLFKVKNKAFTKKVLNNSIKNPQVFLQSFKIDYKYANSNFIHTLQVNSVQDFYSNIHVKHQWLDDGLFFVPAKIYVIKNDSIYFANNQVLAAKNFTDYEKNLVAELIERLLYEHRCLGSELYHIFAEPLGAETTVVMHGKNRNVLSFSSYAQLSFHLNELWKNKKVYAKALDLKKINGLIEFKLNILVKKDKGYDFAEIRFRLDEKYTPDLVMMILHPYLKEIK